ncbi:MAG: hypothetical protein R3C25_00080 [Hyphomonadaceae bacterium]
MGQKWVDNEVYFGPDRRRRDASKRWSERRRYNDAAERPPLGAVLRRLRVQISVVGSPEQRRHLLDLAKFALSEAERQYLPECADHLREALRHITLAQYDAADAHIVEALVFANAR